MFKKIALFFKKKDKINPEFPVKKSKPVAKKVVTKKSTVKKATTRPQKSKNA